MKNLTLLLALCGSVAAEPPKPEPWPKYKLVGYLQSDDGFQLFGVGNKRLTVESPTKFGVRHEPLAFASQADYQRAELLIGQLVEVEAIEVTRGLQRVYVPVVLVERK